MSYQNLEKTGAVARALAAAAEIYGESMSDVRLMGYLTVISGHDPDRLIQSIGELCKEMQYFPRPADIISRAKQIGRREYMGRPLLSGLVGGGGLSDSEVRVLIDRFAKRIGLHRMGDDSLKTFGQMTDDEREAVERGGK